jgi:hypothetical protein
MASQNGDQSGSVFRDGKENQNSMSGFPFIPHVYE